MCVLYDRAILRYTDNSERGGIVSPKIGGSSMNETAKKYIDLFRQVYAASSSRRCVKFCPLNAVDRLHL